MDELIVCRSLTKKYEKRIALDEVTFSVRKGRIVGLLGPNGSGKTTLLKLINGLLVPSSGDLLINSLRPGVETKKMTSFLPERNCLNNWMKVKELVTFYSEFYPDFCQEKAYHLLRDLDIDSSARLKALSKGTKEKVQLILVMSRDAELYCLDEPIGGVDPASRDYIIETILKCYNRKATILISTHLIADIESILDDVIFINYGRIMQTLAVDDIRAEGTTVDQVFRRMYAKKTYQV